jgi:division protein CdvB (Snf7/Vps24/ESCRT-III family)
MSASLLGRFLRKGKLSNSIASPTITTFLSIDEVKTQINASRVTLEQTYRDLFVKCVRAQQAKTSPFTAVKYAFQCAQVKKTAQLVIASLVDLERVVLRAGTAQEFCDTAAKLTPIIQNVSDGVAGVLPEVSTRLEQIGDTLDDLVITVRAVAPQMWAAPSSGRDREQIFVGVVAVDERLREDLQPVPTDGVFLDELKKRMYPYIDAFTVKLRQ